MDSRAIIGLFFLSLAACETVPKTLDPVLFEREIVTLTGNPSVASSDRQIAELLGRPDLTEGQRANAVFLRAEKRLDARFNLPGALEDFDTFMALQPEDTRRATAERRKLFVTEEIESAQRRLARLQNLSDWFDDKVLMGDVSAGAVRYRTAGLTPNPAQLYLLRESGFVCDDPGESDLQVVHQYGAARDDVEGAVWCDDPSLS
ncbi:MAG: hypothetical protein AAF331_14875 [Pseudomonadota bacterium]